MKLKETQALDKGREKEREGGRERERERERESKFFDCHNNHCATKFDSTQYLMEKYMYTQY